MKARWQHAPDVAWVGDAERAIVLVLSDRTTQPMLFDAAGSAIWVALGEPRDLASLAEQFAGDAEPAAVEEPLSQYLDDLVRRGFLVIV